MSIYDGKEILAIDCKVGDTVIMESHLCTISDIKHYHNPQKNVDKLLFFTCDINTNNFCYRRFSSGDKVMLLVKHE